MFDDATVDYVARELHEAYVLLAPEYGYSAGSARGVKWDAMSPRYRSLMTAIVRSLYNRGVIR